MVDMATETEFVAKKEDNAFKIRNYAAGKSYQYTFNNK